MVAWNLALCFLLMTLLDCSISSNVSLTLSEESTCPSVPVTAQCTVKQPEPADSLFLVWGCIGEDGMNNERLVFCEDDHVSKLICKFGDIYDIRGVFCGTVDGEKIIKSEATFNTTSMCDMLVFCSYGENEIKSTSASIQDLKAPKLSTVSSYNELMNEVTVFWSVDDCTSQEVEYILSVNSSLFSAPMDHKTSQTNMTLSLHRGIQYNLTVTAQLCDGNVTSNPSDPLPLFIPVKSTSVQVTPMPTESATMSANTESSNVAVIVATVVMSILVAGILVLVIIALLVKKKRSQAASFKIQAQTSSSHNMTDLSSFSQESTREQRLNSERNRGIPERSGVAILYVDDRFIYYSCTEEYEDATNEYAVRRCEHDGTLVDSHLCDCFVRGIGLDHDGNVYILCSSADAHVLKLSKDFNFLGKTKNQCSRHFGEAKGMIVTTEFVLVTSEKFSHICVFDLQLNFCYNLKLKSIEGLIEIATFQNRYIVTGKGTISILDIDFQNGEVKSETALKSMYHEYKTVDFDPNVRLRGICAIDNNIYVTRINLSENICGLPITCLEFDGERLNYVCEDTNVSRHCTEICTEKCRPVVIFSHNQILYYSQGSHGKLYHIVKATHLPGKPIESTKMFDVC